MKYRNFLALPILLSLATCGHIATGNSLGSYLKRSIDFSDASHHMELTPVKFSSIDGWEEHNRSKAIKSFSRSCSTMLRRPKNASLSAYAGTYGDWHEVCNKATQLHTKNETASTFFNEYFTPYLVTNNGKEEGLLTGYYQAQLNGSATRSDRYRYPIYALPPKKLIGLSRKAIDNGALKNKGLELVYVDDPVELFFLHIQGSGLIALDNGKTMHVGYAGQNGMKYQSIGRYLVDKEIFTLENITANKIKDWLRDNPDELWDVLHLNPSYIYFKKNNQQVDPIGAQGIPLTATASLAVDKRFIPLGTPVWVNTTYDGKKPLKLLTIAQDTGGAIKGVVRGDIFFGHGKEAELNASRMKHQGRIYLLLPKTIEPTVRKWRVSNNPPK